ncbi:Leucine carboxyl methyltransferase 1 [Mycena indigotica]|uniref:Leucine carboxyl methyltransferase 1 n=1 Tax=Mycena indigotica TaxID=2126181 RepID=A0A8H6S1G5_9AGAR|nr:Leucine carboxyl methyltransferase 1 [Mycena indigotica]KAF7290573.1 Leucine carboxyl methyltransferase 1 [Mycena indigotica]
MFPPPTQDADSAIRLTDSDAALARLSAVRKKYLEDPFIPFLVPRAAFQTPRPPLINIGTFVRATAIDDLVFQWLQTSLNQGIRSQIISLGAGSDTRFWRIATGPYKDALETYIELDFPDITSKKAMAIRKSKDLSAILGEVNVSLGGTGLTSTNYHLLPVDLRLPPEATLANHLSSAILSSTLPTLLLFECVLVYMSPEASSAILQWFVEFFSGGETAPLGSIVYEMFGLQDAFGRVMVENLKARNVSLPGAAPYSDIHSLPTRFTNVGFTAAHALTLKEIRKSYISATELERIAHLELVDEVEELELVLNHYAITWGLCAPTEALRTAWGGWGLVKAVTIPSDEDDE